MSTATVAAAAAAATADTPECNKATLLSQKQNGAETNNNNNNAQDAAQDHEQQNSTSDHSGKPESTRPESSRNKSLRETAAADAAESSPLGESGQEARRRLTKVKSSSDLVVVAATDGDKTAATSGERDMSGSRRSQATAAAATEDAPRDKSASASASGAAQVEQTQGAQQQREQREQAQQLCAEDEAASQVEAAAAAAAARAGAQGQGQGQGAGNKTNTPAAADQNTANSQKQQQQQQQQPEHKENSPATGCAHQRHQQNNKENNNKNDNNNNNNTSSSGGSNGHHILELNNNNTNQSNSKQETPHRNHQEPYLTTTTTGGGSNHQNGYYNKATTPNLNHHHYHQQPTTTTRRLSYLQALLLRKWPGLALGICIMSSLLFGFLLSAATVYLMHGFTNCNDVLLASGAHNPHHQHDHHEHLHHLHHQQHDLAAGSSLLPTPLGLSDTPPSIGLAANAAVAAGVADETRRAGAPDTPTSVSTSAAAAGDDKQLTNKTASIQAAAAAAAPTSGGQFQRLPGSVVPQHYELFVWPTIAGPDFPFNGSVEIHVTCKAPTDSITLHALDLIIAERSITLSRLPSGSAGAGTRARRQAAASAARAANATTARELSAPRVARLSQDKLLQYSIVHLEAPLEAGQDYLLRMDFAGRLNDDLAGFYRMNYERPNSSEPTWIAATQFQATDARRAFPCFDEPLYKATFGIKIRHWANMTALSNMPIVASKQSQDGLWITDTFAKSQRMSTYLVAWAVTNFESRSSGNITVWTRPGRVHTAEYALDIAGRILRFYEQFFGIAYPLPKMDMIALPDFNAGAMENWGLITYRETAMLYDPETSSVANKQRVAVVVAHELAHQWFGNLVTPKWWDDLWLNEGFASFVEYLGVNHVEPGWRMLDQFIVEEIQEVFKLDTLASTHQISIPVNNPEEISEIFDHISYAKGASIIRMMRHFLTAPVFQLGLQRYLRALKYDNAEQADLWAHLRAAQLELRGTGKSNGTSAAAAAAATDLVDVDKVMNSWTLQTGYPLVTLVRNYSGATARLDQVRYQPYKIVQDQLQQQQQQQSSASTSASANSKSSQQMAPLAAAAPATRWEIPITYTCRSEQDWEPRTRLWLHGYTASSAAASNSTAVAPVEISPALTCNASASDWVLLNLQQVGYFRVNYDLQNWRLLIAQLQEDHTKLGAANRAQLLDDLFELAKSSLVSYELAMESTKYLHKEREYLPWESVLLALGHIDEMLQRTALYGDWQDYLATRVIDPFYARYRHLSWTRGGEGSKAATATTTNGSQIDSNDVLEQYNQVNAISWACQTNNAHCIGQAKGAFAAWRSTGANNIMPSMRYAAYCAAIQHGTRDDWDFLWRAYEREQGAAERDRILRALGCSKEMWILARYLDWIFDKSKPIRRQDGAFVFRMIAKNLYGRDLAFNFMREHWPTIREYYGKTSFTLGHLIKSVSSGMNTQVELDQLRRFHESIKNDVGTGKRSFQIAIEEVESNLYWRNKNYKILEKWLADNHNIQSNHENLNNVKVRQQLPSSSSSSQPAPAA